MKLLDAIPPGQCRPLRIVPPGEACDGLIGGARPRAAVPARRGPNTRYFCTLPLGEGGFVSIFLHGDFGQMWDARGVWQPGGRLAEAVVHRDLVRSGEAELRSELSPHGLALLDSVPDRRDDGGPRSGHKLGGSPSLLRPLEADGQHGGRLVAQIDFPGPPDDLVSGPWPFGEGLFFLFEEGPSWGFAWDS